MNIASSRTFSTNLFLLGDASPPTPKLEDQASVFTPPGDRVAQLYPWTILTEETTTSETLAQMQDVSSTDVNILKPC
jgi:hypothetical protein